MRRLYIYLLLFSIILHIWQIQLLSAAETNKGHHISHETKIMSLPKSWFDTTPIYEEPQLLLYINKFAHKCTECHKDLQSPPIKSHLPFGAHHDMVFDHGLNLRCLNCHHIKNPDAYIDYDGSEIPNSKPVMLCRKCHGIVFREWESGIHGRINGYWNTTFGPQKKLKCNQCHNPHNPRFPHIKPMPAPVQSNVQLPKEDSHHE